MPEGKAAILEEWRMLPNPRVGQRNLKMLRPVCRICEARPNRPRDWAKSCTHDPYIASVKRTELVPLYEDINDAAGKPTGRQRQTGTDTIVHYEPYPNTVEITISMKVNSGQGYEKARRKGFILPEEVRSPHYPNGIASACQFRGCYNQKNLVNYNRFGVFCRPMELALVAQIEKASLGMLEIGWDAGSQEIRDEQLGAIVTKVRGGVSLDETEPEKVVA